jgi:hypothetical protein
MNHEEITSPLVPDEDSWLTDLLKAKLHLGSENLKELLTLLSRGNGVPHTKGRDPDADADLLNIGFVETDSED